MPRVSKPKAGAKPATALYLYDTGGTIIGSAGSAQNTASENNDQKRCFFADPSEIRTPDTLIKRQVLIYSSTYIKTIDKCTTMQYNNSIK